MSSYKVHAIVECLKQQEFPFDAFEIEEELDKVLLFFNIYETLTSEERYILKKDLVSIALAREFSEMALMTTEQDFSQGFTYLSTDN